jgi:hypothetical protein
MIADKTGSAGDEYMHGKDSISLTWMRMIDCFMGICISSECELASACCGRVPPIVEFVILCAVCDGYCKGT